MWLDWKLLVVQKKEESVYFPALCGIYATFTGEKLHGKEK